MHTDRRAYLTLAVMGASLAVIVTMEWAFHIGLLFILAAGLSVLLAMAYVFSGRARTAQSNSKIFWAVLEGSVIFFAGALYGVVESFREGWQWTDLLYLVVPTALGSYLLWFALKVRRKATTSSG